MKKIIYLTLIMFSLLNINLTKAFDDSKCKETDYNNSIKSDFYEKSYTDYQNESYKNENIASLKISDGDTNKDALIWNGIEYNTYNSAYGDGFPIFMFFSNNKSSVSYIAKDYDNTPIIVKDGKKISSFSYNTPLLQYSPKQNSNLLLYTDGSGLISINSDKIEKYKYDDYPSVSFSKDGNKIYAFGERNNKSYLLTCDISDYKEDKIVNNNEIKLNESQTKIYNQITSIINGMIDKKGDTIRQNILLTLNQNKDKIKDESKKEIILSLINYYNNYSIKTLNKEKKGSFLNGYNLVGNYVRIDGSAGGFYLFNNGNTIIFPSLKDQDGNLFSYQDIKEYLEGEGYEVNTLKILSFPGVFKEVLKEVPGIDETKKEIFIKKISSSLSQTGGKTYIKKSIFGNDYDYYSDILGQIKEIYGIETK